MALSSSWIAASPAVAPVVIDDPTVPEAPDEFAVPALLVPGGDGGAILTELPLPGLLRPPVLAELEVAPALAEEPPAPCASAPTVPARMVIATIDAVADILVIRKSPFIIQRQRWAPVPRRNDFQPARLSRYLFAPQEAAWSCAS